LNRHCQEGNSWFFFFIIFAAIKGDAKSTTLFVGNMPYDAADDDILKLFKPCGEIAQVRAGIDAGTQRTKGFAYIEFATQEAADKAMAMINPMLKGRTLRLVRGFFFFFFFAT